jgi:hypothetical protein
LVAIARSARRKNVARESNRMRRIVITLAVVSVVFHVGLITFTKTEGLSNVRTLLLVILFVGWGALPFVILITLGEYLTMPRIAVTLGVFCLIALSLLFWDVYVSDVSSTAAIGLATGPVILGLLNLLTLGASAALRVFWRRGNKST